MKIRARSNHRAEIEDQFFILSQMADEIRESFQEGANRFEQIAKEDAIRQSQGESLIYDSVINNYAYEMIRRRSMCSQSRQIVFCAIYAYYETMLNRIISYYQIPFSDGDLNDAKTMYGNICTEFFLRSKGEKLGIAEDEFINDYCRLLRNHFMHGVLSKKKKREELKLLSEKHGGIIYDQYDYAEISTPSFIQDVLNSVYNMVISIDNAFDTI